MDPNDQLNQNSNEQFPVPPPNVQPPMQPFNEPRQPQTPVTGAENPYYDQQVQPGQVIGYGLPTDQQVYGTKPLQPPSKFKLTILALLMLVMLLVLIGGAVYGISKLGKSTGQNNVASNKSDTNLEQINPQIPDDWETIDTDYDFSLKAPGDWELGDSSDSNFENLESKGAIIAESNEDSFSSEQEAQPQPPASSISLDVGSSKLNDSTDQAKFEEFITSDAAKKPYAELFGISENEIKISSKKVKIGDREWLQLDIDTPQAITRSYYHWVKDHAVSVSIIEVGTDRTKFEENIKKYLQPAAASVEIYDEEE